MGFRNLVGPKPVLSWPMFPLNTDGMTIYGSNMLIENIKIRNYDDAVVFKSNSNGCTEDIVVRNASVTFGLGMAIGAIPPDVPSRCVRNVTFEDIDFKYPVKAIYVKTNPGDPIPHEHGVIEDIMYNRINMYNPIWWGIYIGP